MMVNTAKIMKVFECPFRADCHKARLEAFENPTTLYADNQAQLSIMPYRCPAPFLETDGQTVCLLYVERDKLTLENYQEKIAQMDIHSPKMSLIQEMEEAWRRWRKTR